MIKGDIESFSIDALSHDGALYYATLRVMFAPNVVPLLSPVKHVQRKHGGGEKIIILDNMEDIDEEDRVYLAMKYPDIFG